MIKGNVNVVGGWGEQFAKTVNRRVADELTEATNTGASVAGTIAQTRHRTGLMGKIEIIPVKGTPTGWAAGFRSAAWYAHFQNKGTSRGIKPLRFLEAGRLAARKQLVERLNRI